MIRITAQGLGCYLVLKAMKVRDRLSLDVFPRLVVDMFLTASGFMFLSLLFLQSAETV